MKLTTSSSKREEPQVKSRTMAYRAHESSRQGSQLKRDRCPDRGRVMRHDVAVVMRRMLPLLLIGLVVFALIVPVSTVAFFDQSIFNLSFTHDQLKFRFYLDQAQPILVAAAVLFGAAVSFVLFKFVTIRSESTASFSLSLSRGKLFGVRAVCGLVVVVFAICIPFAISLALNLVALGDYAGLVEHGLYVALGVTLVSAVAFLLMALALGLSGTVVEALLAFAALSCLVTVAAFGADQLASSLLLGNPYGSVLLGSSKEVAPSLLELSSAANPLLFFYEPAAQAQTFSILHPVYEPEACDWTLLCFWALLALVIAVLGVRVFCGRKAEIAGIANTNRPLTIAVAVVFSTAFLGAVMAALSSIDAAVAAVAGLAAFALVAFLLLRGPLRGPLSSVRGLVVSTVVSTACAGVVVVMFATGGLGFSSTVPDASKVTCVRVSYVGAPDYVAARMDSAQAGSGSYYYAATYEYSDADAVRCAVEAQRTLMELGGLSLDSTQANFADTVVPYDLVFEYAMSDGTFLTRYYDKATYGVIAQLLALDDAPEVVQAEKAVVSGDVSSLGDALKGSISSSFAFQAFGTGSLYVSDPYYAHPKSVSLSTDERASLLAALAADVAEQGSQDRYYPDSACRGVLMFTQSGQSDAESFAYQLQNSVVYLTDSFTRTLAWLEENDLAELMQPRVEDIESLTFQRYDSYASSNGPSAPQSIVFKGYRDVNASNFVTLQEWGSLYSTTDVAEISEVAPLLRNTYAVDGGGYLVCAKLTGIDAYSYFFIPADEASSELKRAIG